jgi:hypothetical protein
MRRSVLFLASPFVAGLLWTAAPPCFADDSATSAPAPGGDWFRNTSPTPGTSSSGPSTPQQNTGDDHRVFAPYNQQGDYPSRDLRDWVFANAHAATSRAIFSRAENDLAAAFSRAQRSFEHSKAYVEAVADEKDAYDAYNVARQKAMADLYDDPKYHELLRLRDQLTEKIAIRRANKDASKDEILALATLKMEYASDARSMESAILSGDAKLAEARKRMMAASQKTVQMRADHDDALRDNPQILAARENLEDARISLITSQAYLNGSYIAGAQALDYAYYLHRNDVGRYDPYANGYGGAYSPYWVRY